MKACVGKVEVREGRNVGKREKGREERVKGRECERKKVLVCKE